MWILKGKYKDAPYENISLDIEYLKGFLTKVLHGGGTGFIYKEV